MRKNVIALTLWTLLLLVGLASAAGPYYSGSVHVPSGSALAINTPLPASPIPGMIYDGAGTADYNWTQTNDWTFLGGNLWVGGTGTGVIHASGAGLGSGTIPNTSLATLPLTSLTCNNNIFCSPSAAPTPIVQLASPAPSICPSAMAGWSSTYGLQYVNGCAVMSIVAGNDVTITGTPPSPTVAVTNAPTFTGAVTAGSFVLTSNFLNIGSTAVTAHPAIHSDGSDLFLNPTQGGGNVLGFCYDVNACAIGFGPTDSWGTWLNTGLTVIPPFELSSSTDTINTVGLSLSEGQNVVETVPLPTPSASPSATSSPAGSIGSTTYFVKYTLSTGNDSIVGGETKASPEQSFAVAANNVLIVNAPLFYSSSYCWNVYVSTTTGTETEQASCIAGGTNWTEPTSGLIAGNALPSANTAFGIFTTGPSYYGPYGANTHGSITAFNFLDTGVLSASCVGTDGSGKIIASSCAGSGTIGGITPGSNIAVTTPSPSSPTVAVASPSPTACPSAMAGWSSTFGLQYMNGCAVTSLVAGNDVVLSGSAPSPTVAVTNAPSFTGRTTSGSFRINSFLDIVSSASTSIPSIDSDGSDLFINPTATNTLGLCFDVTSCFLGIGPSNGYGNWQNTGITVKPNFLLSTSTSSIKNTGVDIGEGGNITQVNPLPSPSASPNATSSPAGSIGSTTYFVKYTFSTGSQGIIGGETNASPEQSFAVAANNVLIVNAPTSYSSAQCWNVYVSTTTGTETKQASCITLGSSWTEPTSGLISGSALPSSNTAYGLYATGNSYFSQLGLQTGGNLNILKNGTATSATNQFGSSGGLVFFQSLYNGGAANKTDWDIFTDTNGNLIHQYAGILQTNWNTETIAGVQQGYRMQLCETTCGVSLYTTQLNDGTSTAYHLYRLNETTGTTAFDYGTSISNGTYNGTFTLNAQPLSLDQSGATQFDGATSYVSLGYTDVANASSGGFSAEAVFIPTSVTGTQVILANQAAGATTGGFAMYLNGTTLTCAVSSASAHTTAAAAATIAIGTTYYALCSYSASTKAVTIYLSGASGVASTALGAIYAVGGSNANIGRYPSGTADYFTGTIQSVALYQGTTTGTQATAHYNASGINGSSGTFGGADLTPSQLRLGPAASYGILDFGQIHTNAWTFSGWGTGTGDLYLGSSGSRALNAGTGNFGSSNPTLTLGVSGNNTVKFIKAFQGGGAGQFTDFSTRTSGDAVNGIVGTALDVDIDNTTDILTLSRGGDLSFLHSLVGPDSFQIDANGQVISNWAFEMLGTTHNWQWTVDSSLGTDTSVWRYNASNEVEMDSGGHLALDLAGGTSSAGITFGTSNTKTWALKINADQGAGTFTDIGENTSATVNTISGTALYVDKNNSTNLMTLDTSGNMGIAGTLHQTSSRTKKRNISPIPFDPLQMIENTNWVQWCYKENPTCNINRPGDANFGFIAEDTSAYLSGSQHNDMVPSNIAGVDAAAIKELAQKVDRIKNKNGTNYNDSDLRHEIYLLQYAVIVLVVWVLGLTLYVVLKKK